MSKEDRFFAKARISCASRFYYVRWCAPADGAISASLAGNKNFKRTVFGNENYG